MYIVPTPSLTQEHLIYLALPLEKWANKGNYITSTSSMEYARLVEFMSAEDIKTKLLHGHYESDGKAAMQIKEYNAKRMCEKDLVWMSPIAIFCTDSGDRWWVNPDRYVAPLSVKGYPPKAAVAKPPAKKAVSAPKVTDIAPVRGMIFLSEEDWGFKFVSSKEVEKKPALASEPLRWTGYFYRVAGITKNTTSLGSSELAQPLIGFFVSDNGAVFEIFANYMASRLLRESKLGGDYTYCGKVRE